MLEQILIVVSVTSLAMVTPGADMVLVMRNTLVGGRRAGFQTSLGVLSGNLVHITYCVLGIGVLISQSIVAFSVLKSAAAVYLIYLGVMSVRAGAKTLDTARVDHARRTRTWFVQGFVNNLLNPKGALFYLGVFTIVITPGTSFPSMLFLIFTMMVVSLSFWLLFVLTLDRPAIRNFFDRSQQAVNLIFGGLLILLGIKVASAQR